MSKDPIPLLYSLVRHSDFDDVQMFSHSFEEYVPPGIHVWRQLSYLRQLVDFAPTTPLLRHARRTIGLTYIATTSHDSGVIREARIAHGKLLGMLQFSLAFPRGTSNAGQMRELVDSIALLTHLNDPVAGFGHRDNSWVAHLLGAQQLLASHGRVCLNTADRLDAGIMRHTVMNGFLLAIAQRQSWDVDAAWLDGIQSKGWTKLVAALHPLPGLLEMTDRALLRDNEASRLSLCVLGLGEIKERVSEMFPEAGHPQSIDVGSSEFLSADVEEHYVMSDRTIYPALFAPMSDDGSTTALLLVYSTSLALICESTILRIWHFRPDTLKGVSVAAQRIV